MFLFYGPHNVCSIFLKNYDNLGQKNHKSRTYAKKIIIGIIIYYYEHTVYDLGQIFRSRNNLKPYEEQGHEGLFILSRRWVLSYSHV